MAYFKLDRNEEASNYAKNALELANELEYEDGKIIAYNNLARIYLSLRDISEALDFANKAIILSHKIRDEKLQANALRRYSNS